MVKYKKKYYKKRTYKKIGRRKFSRKLRKYRRKYRRTNLYKRVAGITRNMAETKLYYLPPSATAGTLTANALGNAGISALVYAPWSTN